MSQALSSGLWGHDADPNQTCLLTGWVALAKSLDLSEP